jgi:hypothetical protein
MVDAEDIYHIYTRSSTRKGLASKFKKVKVVSAKLFPNFSNYLLLFNDSEHVENWYAAFSL